DGKPLTEIDRAFTASGLSTGKHKLTIAADKGDASLEFEFAPAAIPAVIGPIEARKLTIVAVGRYGDRGTIAASEPTPVKLAQGTAIDAGPEAKPLQLAPDQSAQLANTALATRTIPLTRAETPELTVVAALETGALVVVTGDDHATISLNGEPVQRQPQNGRLYFRGLAPGEYEVRASRPGAPDRVMTARVEKGKQVVAQLSIKEVPPPKPAAAPVQVLRPRAQAAPIPAEAAPKPHLPRPQVTEVPEAPVRPVEQGIARFTVKTPGARVTIRRADGHDPLTRLVIVDSLRLPVGKWVMTATAPGYETYTAPFL